MDSLIDSFRNFRAYLGKKKHDLLPRNDHRGFAVAQVFLSEEGIRSVYVLTNFPSLYSPNTAVTYLYDTNLRDENGSLVGEKTVEIPAFASVEVDPGKLFAGELPSQGVFSARIRSRDALYYADRHLGVIQSHFYATYRGIADRAFSVIHPQTTIDPGLGLNVEWESSQIVPAGKVREIRLYQMNPNTMPTTVVHNLNSRKRGILAESRIEIPGYGVRSVVWDLSCFPVDEDDFYFISATRLPGPNAKPLMFLFFGEGVFTASHA